MQGLRRLLLVKTAWWSFHLHKLQRLQRQLPKHVCVAAGQHVPEVMHLMSHTCATMTQQRAVRRPVIAMLTAVANTMLQHPLLGRKPARTHTSLSLLLTELWVNSGYMTVGAARTANHVRATVPTDMQWRT